MSPPRILRVLAALSAIAVHAAASRAEIALAPLAEITISARGPGLPSTTAAADSPAAEGVWSGPFVWPLEAVHLTLLPDKRVLAWSSGYGPAVVWDPANDSFRTLPPTRNKLFCSGHSFLSDGRVLVAGGHLNSTPSGNGSPDLNIFDYGTNTWVTGPRLATARWYPGTTTLPTGEVLVLSGQVSKTKNSKFPEVWQTDGTLRTLSTAKRGLPAYPRTHVAPDGRVFVAGPKADARYLNPSGTGAWSDAPDPAVGDRDYGTSVMYAEGKVLIVGGGGRKSPAQPTNTAEIIDLVAGGGWRLTNPMTFARRQLNATILADGKVLVTGGSSASGFNNPDSSVLAAEIWDPATELWTTVASMKVRRLYHSTAILLPDGRVLSAGGNDTAGGESASKQHKDAEIYSPPYLFNPDGTEATRPALTSSPLRVGYGETFFIETPDADRIVRVNWIRLSSVTHAFNETQRLSSLSFTPVDGGLNVTAPASANLAPPGPYMLFLVDADGVPSVAPIILIN
jgi:hypothetical protein